MRVYAVGEVGAYLQDVYATDEVLSDVWITGEITNFTRASSGHLGRTLIPAGRPSGRQSNRSQDQQARADRFMRRGGVQVASCREVRLTG